MCITFTAFQGSLSRAFALTKANSDTNSEKPSPTSSSGSSSIISRISPPLQMFRSSRSGGESPIYAIPFAHQTNASPMNRRSDSGEYDLTRSSQSVARSEIMDSAKNEKGNLLYSLIGGSLQRSKRQHRRVRSISDIDVHVQPV